MLDNFEKIFKETDAVLPPKDLHAKIMHEVALRQARNARMKVAASAGIFIASTYFVVAGFLSLWAQLAQSGFFDFASLIFSDFSAAAANFPDFANSLAESFPVFSAAIFFAGLAAVIWSAAIIFDGTAIWRRHIFSSLQ